MSLALTTRVPITRWGADSIALWRRALAIAPNDGDAANNLGLALIAPHRGSASQDWDGARRAHAIAGTLSPAHFEAHYNHGVAAGRLAAAARNKARAGVADATAAARAFEREAEGAYESALAIEPGLVSAMQNLATIRQRAGDVTAARALYERVLAAAPAHAGAMANLEVLDRHR